MSSLRTSLNSYLALEFDVEFEGEDPPATDTWPFELADLGTFNASSRRVRVFGFNAGGEDYFAVADPSLSFLSRSGMSVEQLRLQYLGSAWLAQREPVDQSMAIIGDPAVPSGLTRRDACANLARKALGPGAVVSTAVFLKRGQSYLVVAASNPGAPPVVVGDGVPTMQLPSLELSEWRLLSLAIGLAVESGRLAA